jgi:hypothetical protein
MSLKKELLKFFTLAAVITTVFAGSVGAAEEAVSSATVLSLEGVCEVKYGGADPWVPFMEGTVISAGDEIATHDDGAVDIELPDESIVRIGPNSHVCIKEMGLLEVTNTTTNHFLLLVGKIRAVVAPFVNKESVFTIETENATVGVRGTDFGVFFDPAAEKTEALCFDGNIHLTAKENAFQGLDLTLIPEEKRFFILKRKKTASIITGLIPEGIKKLHGDRRDSFLSRMTFHHKSVIDKIEHLKELQKKHEALKKMKQMKKLNEWKKKGRKNRFGDGTLGNTTIGGQTITR